MEHECKTPLEEFALAANLKTALVTGAGSGIGRSIAMTLAKMGLRVALVGRDREKLERTRASSSAATTPPSSHLAISPTGPPSSRSSARLSPALESIDVLVCNAGTNVKNRSLESLDPADWDRMIATRTSLVRSTWCTTCCPRCAGGKRAGDPDLLGLGHSCQHAGGAGYSASKFGQSALGICLGARRGPHGIRSSVIYPGEVETPILDARPVPVGAERRTVILQPEDVAAAVKFLVELHPRAHVPELVIKPTVDDFC